jgi:cell wall-associated NlpC family hydrolase
MVATTLRVLSAPVLLAVLALTVTPSPRTVEATPQTDLAIVYANQIPTLGRITAAGTEWEYDATPIGIAPPPPKKHVAHTYGSTPALTGPILAIAASYVGVSYVSGGESPSGFDCSGFVQYVYAQNGISVSRSVAGLRNAGTVTTDPQPGDIIWTSHHVALYVAPGWQIDSPRPGKTIQVRPIWQSNPTYIHVG